MIPPASGAVRREYHILGAVLGHHRSQIEAFSGADFPWCCGYRYQARNRRSRQFSRRFILGTRRSPLVRASDTSERHYLGPKLPSTADNARILAGCAEATDSRSYGEAPMCIQLASRRLRRQGHRAIQTELHTSTRPSNPNNRSPDSRDRCYLHSVRHAW